MSPTVLVVENEAADPIGSLDRATRGQRPDSARYREVMSPLGLGDELRAVLISGNQCWGAMCLHREDAEHGFDDQEVDVIRRIAPHVAEGLRRAVTLGPLRAPAESTAAAGAPAKAAASAAQPANPVYPLRL